MHILHRDIGIPQVTTKVLSSHETLISISPLPYGFSHTLGNSLRRVMLSSLPGVAVTGVKIAGAAHEFASLTGMSDSVLDVVLRLKKLQISMVEGMDTAILTLALKGNKAVKAGDIKAPTGVEITNKDLELTYLDPEGHLDMQIRVQKGVGYLSIADLELAEDAKEWILIDASFTPVRKLRYEVATARVGQMTNLDTLNLYVETDGSMSAIDAFRFGSDILRSYFTYFNTDGVVVEPDYMTTEIVVAKKEDQDNRRKEPKIPVEVLSLSPRTLNALIRGNIGYVEDLVKITPAQLAALRGFGKKGMMEVQAALEERGHSLGGQID